MQGQLRNEALSIDIRTACGHCGRPLRLTVDNRLNIQVHNQGAEVLAFFPDVNWSTLEDPTIIHAY